MNIERIDAAFFLGLSHFFLLRSTKCCACRCLKWFWGIQSRVPASGNHHHATNQIRRAFSTLWNRCQVHQILTCHTRWLPKAPFILTHVNVSATCRKCHACCADENVSDVLHLSRKNCVSDCKISRKVSPFRRKMELVKQALRKRAPWATVSCETSFENGRWKELLCCKGRQICWTRRTPLLSHRAVTPIVRTRQCGHIVWGTKTWNNSLIGIPRKATSNIRHPTTTALAAT